MIELSNEHDFYAKFFSIPYLEREIENILILEAQKGNKKAQNKIIFHNIKAIIEAIKPCKCNYRYDENDLFQESIIGMTRAIQSYDTQKELKFRHYAQYYIKKHISLYINNNNLAIKVPPYIQLLFKRIKKLEYKYLLENNYNYPSTLYYSKELNVPENVILRCIESLDKDQDTYINELMEEEENNEI